MTNDLRYPNTYLKDIDKVLTQDLLEDRKKNVAIDIVSLIYNKILHQNQIYYTTNYKKKLRAKLKSNIY